MIIVTGGTSGIGAEITKHLRNEGNEVITISRRNLSNNKYHYQCDISNYSKLKEIYYQINKKKFKIKALINCAGIASMNLAITTPPQITENLVKTNLVGTIFTNQIFAPLLIKSGGGRIINFSTIAVSLALKGESVYVATKAGVEAFSRTFANELSSFGITVNCIAPGPIRTDLLSGISDKQIKSIVQKQIIKKEMKTYNVLKMIKILLNENSEDLTGQVLHIGGV